MKTLIAMLILTAGIAGTTGTAEATVLNFSYTTQSGAIATGIVDATDLGGFYSVNNVAGKRDGVTITGYDFFDPTPQSFNFASGQASNVDFSFYIGSDNFEIRWPGGGGSFGTEFRTDLTGGVTSLLVTSFSLSSVPEPATWMMLTLGLGGLASCMRWRKKPPASFA